MGSEPGRNSSHLLPDEASRAGLCARCLHARVIRTDRHTTHYRCGRSDEHPGYPRYPVLPVLRCPGFDPAAPQD